MRFIRNLTPILAAIGGGIIGLAIAEHLSQLMHLRNEHRHALSLAGIVFPAVAIAIVVRRGKRVDALAVVLIVVIPIAWATTFESLHGFDSDRRLVRLDSRVIVYMPWQWTLMGPPSHWWHPDDYPQYESIRCKRSNLLGMGFKDLMILGPRERRALQDGPKADTQ